MANKNDEFWKKKPVRGKNENLRDYINRVRVWQDAKDTMSWFRWKYK